MEKFYRIVQSATLGEVERLTGARLADPSKAGVEVGSLAPLDSAGPDSVSYFSSGAVAASALDRSAKYREMLKGLRAAACFISDKDAPMLPPSVAPLVSADPQLAFIRLTEYFYADRALEFRGVSERASVHSSVKFRDRASVHVGDFAVIEEGVEIGAGCYIGAGAKIKVGVAMGDGCRIRENAVVGHATLGARVFIGEGAVIGGDGFGWHSGPEGHIWVPQLGRVVLNDDVSVGANSCIDRGAMGDTMIGAGTKIDSLVMIGHNVRIGRNCIFAGCGASAGSTIFGDWVLLGAGARVSGHLRIGAGAQVGAGAGVIQDVAPGDKVSGYPAVPVRDFLRQAAYLRRAVRHKK